VKIFNYEAMLNNFTLQMSFNLKNEETLNSYQEVSASETKNTFCHSLKPSTMGMKWHESFIEKGKNGPIS
jgi:hypothetical protein